MSADHHEDHGHAPKASGGGGGPSVIKGVTGTVCGMVGFLFTGLFSGNDGGHDHHH